MLFFGVVQPSHGTFSGTERQRFAVSRTPLTIRDVVRFYHSVVQRSARHLHLRRFISMTVLKRPGLWPAFLYILQRKSGEGQHESLSRPERFAMLTWRLVWPC